MQRTRLIPGVLVTVVALLLVACDSDTAGGRPYYTRGIIQGVSPDRETVEVQHESIPGFMPSMTMGFSVRNKEEMVDRKVGDAIKFRMLVTDTVVFIDHIKPISLSQVELEKPSTGQMRLSNGATRLREGDTMPAFAGTDQDGKPVTLETFRGHPLVLTFVFTRCPIPNFCPLMSTNFSELQRAIKAGDGSLSQVRLLSITLDPEFDTPQILKEYGASRGADPAIWTFATGKELDPLIEAFSVFRKTEGGTLSHGLATAFVSSDGTIRKIWRGNGWKPAEVIDAVRTTNGHE